MVTQIRDIWLHAHNMIRSGRQIINEELRPLNLGSTEGNILLHLWTQGGEMRQEQLVEQLDISKPAVSRALDALEEKGYVMRQRDSQDKRVHKISLSDQARSIGPMVERAYNRLYQLALQGLSPQELEDLMRLIGRISANFTQAQIKKEQKQHAVG